MAEEENLDTGGAGENLDLDTGGDGGDGEEFTPFYNTLPETWRQDTVKGMGLEGEDAERMEKYLNKHSTYQDLVKAANSADLMIARNQISNGKPSEDNAELMATWRNERGIPVEADGYNEFMSDIDELTDTDASILPSVYEVAQKYDISGEALRDILGTMIDGRPAMIEQVKQQMALRDNENASSHEANMKSAWGPDYPGNMSAVNEFLDHAPEGFRDVFDTLRDEDGNLLKHNDQFIQYISDVQRKVNPAATIVGLGPSDQAMAQSRTDELFNMMNSDIDGWRNNPSAQQEYAKLLNAGFVATGAQKAS